MMRFTCGRLRNKIQGEPCFDSLARISPFGAHHMHQKLSICTASAKLCLVDAGKRHQRAHEAEYDSARRSATKNRHFRRSSRRNACFEQ